MDEVTYLRRTTVLSLQDRDWSTFHLTELFDSIQRGKRLKRADQQQGTIPYVSSSALNNGVDGFISKANGCRVFSDCISLANSGSVGSAFYEPFEFVASDHVTHLKRKGLKKEHCLFLVATLGKQASNFNFNREINDQRIQGMQVMLPIDTLGNPDWKFMEDYIREREAIQVERCREFLMKRAADIEIERERVIDFELNSSSLFRRKWKSYPISQIFNIRSGKRLESRNRKPGRRPFIGALDNSNGIAGFAGDNNSSLDSNVLGVNYNGNGVCLGFYHPYECIFSDDVKRFHLKSNEGNEFIYLFLKVAIQQQKSKFGYLYKFNATRMARQSIMLPSTDNGEPDLVFMETVGRTITLRLLKQQIAYTEKLFSQ